MVSESNHAHDPQITQQATDQTGRQVRVRFDERNLTTSYSNAFRSNSSAEEVVVDFGFNQIVPVQQQAGQPQQDKKNQPEAEIIFQANHRVIMNHYTAKRLAILLGQLVRQYETQYGELELNAGKRTKTQA
ncbi:MAG: DUF3467 domain-containing protein [Phycisphaera sp.]|nr:DUF3467 domain-containing protein [Phycisphaera sp.]